MAGRGVSCRVVSKGGFSFREDMHGMVLMYCPQFCGKWFPLSDVPQKEKPAP